MGGSKPQPPTIIQAPPPQPISPQAVSETARSSLQAQLEFNPQLQAQAVQSQLQYAPQLAQSQYDIQARFGPLYRALYEQTFPTQTQALEALSRQTLQGLQAGTGLTPEQQALQTAERTRIQGLVNPQDRQNAQLLSSQASQRLQSPQGYTPEQQAAVEAIRQRQRDQVLQNIRESANLGGTLYGGRRELREDRALNELAQGYAAQDIDLINQNRARALAEAQQAQGMTQGGIGFTEGLTQQAQAQQAAQRAANLQNLIAASQVIFPQVQQPSVPNYNASAAPSGDALLAAMMQQAGNFGVVPGTPGSPGFLGSFLRPFGF